MEDLKNQAKALLNQGQELRKNDQFEEAETLLGQALVISDQIQDEVLFATIQDEIGLVFRNTGQLNKAIERFELARSILKEKKQNRALGACLNHLGGTFLKLKNHIKAEETFLEGLTLSDNQSDMQATFYTHLGLLALIRKDYEKAADYFDKAYDIEESLDRNMQLAILLAHKGQLFFAQGQSEEAKEHYKKALDLYKRSNLESTRNAEKVKQLIKGLESSENEKTQPYN